MSDNKTAPTGASVDAFLRSVDHAGRREDAVALLDLMKRASGEPPVMWGESIVGFGRYHYHYKSGRQGDWFLTGFAPRKAAMTVYIMPGFEPFAEELARLGPHKHSSSCLYLGRLSGIDLSVLETMVGKSVDWMRAKYPPAGI